MVKPFTVNKNVKRIIDDADKRPSAVADKAGIRRDIFSRIIHCRRPVYADEVVPLATALQVSIEELFRAES